MITIVRATVEHSQILSDLSSQTFWESHGVSASKKDINQFVSKTYNTKVLTLELENINNYFHIMYVDNQIAGYSKIVLNTPNENCEQQAITKLDRIYLLKEFYGQNLGVQLFNFNINLSKKIQQKGIWLAVWVENIRAIGFYKKMKFKNIGSFDFKISETHSNPNHILFLEYESSSKKH